MIYEALSLVSDQLSRYLLSKNLVERANEVILQNVALVELAGGSGTSNLQLESTVILSLVNIAEEFTLKNQAVSRVQNGTFISRYPKININLYVLIAANDTGNYDNSLRRLGGVIEFFQGKRIFNFQETPPSREILGDVNLLALELIFEIHTLTFEQINHLWGALGGKQLPFVLYKVRLVSLELERDLRSGRVIEEVKGESASTF